MKTKDGEEKWEREEKRTFYKFEYFPIEQKTKRVSEVISEGERLEQPAKITDVTLLFLVETTVSIFSLSFHK